MADSKKNRMIGHAAEEKVIEDLKMRGFSDAKNKNGPEAEMLSRDVISREGNLSVSVKSGKSLTLRAFHVAVLDNGEVVPILPEFTENLPENYRRALSRYKSHNDAEDLLKETFDCLAYVPGKAAKDEVGDKRLLDIYYFLPKTVGQAFERKFGTVESAVKNATDYVLKHSYLFGISYEKMWVDEMRNQSYKLKRNLTPGEMNGIKLSSFNTIKNSDNLFPDSNYVCKYNGPINFLGVTGHNWSLLFNLAELYDIRNWPRISPHFEKEKPVEKPKVTVIKKKPVLVEPKASDMKDIKEEETFYDIVAKKNPKYIPAIWRDRTGVNHKILITDEDNRRYYFLDFGEDGNRDALGGKKSSEEKYGVDKKFIKIKEKIMNTRSWKDSNTLLRESYVEDVYDLDYSPDDVGEWVVVVRQPSGELAYLNDEDDGEPGAGIWTNKLKYAQRARNAESFDDLEADLAADREIKGGLYGSINLNNLQGRTVEDYIEEKGKKPFAFFDNQGRNVENYDDYWEFENEKSYSEYLYDHKDEWKNWYKGAETFEQAYKRAMEDFLKGNINYNI